MVRDLFFRIQPINRRVGWQLHGDASSRTDDPKYGPEVLRRAASCQLINGAR
jgi:hypothetical protein